jgi:hypothetical protein
VGRSHHGAEGKTLESNLFLKLKRDGTIKGRTVAGGNRQGGFITKEDATSPTVTTESILLTAVIDALENRDVAVVDIPNAFSSKRELPTRMIWLSSERMWV